MNYIFKKLLEFIIFTFKCVLSLSLVAFIFAAITYHQNSSITISKYKIKSKNIPKSFDKYKIVQLSDIHNDYYGYKLDMLVSKVEEENPDIIVITGDLVDAQKYNVENTLDFIDSIKDIAPIYFVYGNHDLAINGDSNYERMVEKLEERDVKFLNIKSDSIVKGNESINILGIQDPSTVYHVKELSEIYSNEEKMKYMLDEVTNNKINKDGFTLLLSHRPEYISIYKDYDIDLVLTGHAHGGQFRIPFVGGIYSPGQGFFPKYTAGVHEENETTMIVSRGLGNSRFPIRVFNTPEIVSITLKSK